MKRSRILLILLATVVGPIALADDGLPYLATVTIERGPGAQDLLGERIVSTLHVDAPAKAAAALEDIDGLDVIGVDDTSVHIAFVDRPTVAGAADTRFLENSWVVDFEEQAVRSLAADIRTELEAVPTIDELERYVHDHIVDKSYSRAFDLASQVAASSSGDCTEHAVLLAAMARAHGHHARVVIGNLILESDSGLYAFGHAWTEIHDGQRWTIRDATLPESGTNVQQLRYLPMAILNDEGPGYFMSLLNTMMSMPVRISGVGNPP
ncbi:MAG: transglutaminase-like domain-containing protein [Woeseiaceae bacterium]|nr:transglutaminase-like domain-containing protein [Woeseiaceae bacterium]